MKNLTLTKRGIFLAALALIASTAIAAEVYTYQCPQCGSILSFVRVGQQAASSTTHSMGCSRGITTGC